MVRLSRVLHAGARRPDHGLRHPGPRGVASTAPTAPTPVALAAGEQASGSSRSSGTRRGLGRLRGRDRGHGLRPLAAAARTSPGCVAEHHLNIVASSSQTAPDTGDAACVSTSSSPTPRTWTRCLSSLKGSTASSTPSARCPARADRSCADEQVERLPGAHGHPRRAGAGVGALGGARRPLRRASRTAAGFGLVDHADVRGRSASSTAASATTATS